MRHKRTPKDVCGEAMKLCEHKVAFEAKLNIFTEELHNMNSTCSRSYSKEPKSVTAFDLFTFFRADLIQSEDSWKPSSTSDWLMSA